MSRRHDLQLTTGRRLAVRDLWRTEALDAHVAHRRAYAEVEEHGRRISACRDADADRLEIERHEVAHARAREVAQGIALLAVLVDPDPAIVPIGAIYDRARAFVARLREIGWSAGELEVVYALAQTIVETGRYVPPDTDGIGVARVARAGLHVDYGAALDLVDRWSREGGLDATPGLVDEIEAEVGLLLLDDPIACLDSGPGSPWSQLGQARIDAAAALILRRRGIRRG